MDLSNIFEDHPSMRMKRSRVRGVLEPVEGNTLEALVGVNTFILSCLVAVSLPT